MRLNALGLVRYGHFTGARLDFPPVPEGAPDLHVIYGPNEAGKSTLLSGWLDLLFGIPARTGYNFLHDNSTLRLEAEIATAQGPLAVARTKGNKNTLLDLRSDAALPEATLSAALGGLDRAAYTTMFSLDDDTIEAGGQSILDSKGELGELLFAASSGLADLSAELAAQQAACAEWFKPSGRKHALAALKARLAELTAERRAVDLAVSDWRKLVEAVAQAEASYRDARDRRAETQARLEAVRRDLDARPMLARLRRMEDRLRDLPAPRAIAPEWRAGLPGWLREEAELAALLPAARDAVGALEAALEALPEDDAAAPYVARLDDLEGRFGAIAAEQADLPRRRAELAALEAEQAELLARLGRPGLALEDALLPQEMQARLAEMIERAGLLEAQASSAAEELARAEAALPDGPEAPAPDEAALARLKPLVAELRRADLPRARREAAARLETAQSVCNRAFAALAPWQGDAKTLAALDLPDAESLLALEQALAAADKAARGAGEECARLEERIARLRAEGDVAAPVSGAAVQKARAAREAAWGAHKTQLSPESAEAFESAMRTDDKMQAARLAQARMAEKLALLRQEEAALEQAILRRDAALEELAAQKAALHRHWAALGVDAEGRSVADLRGWLARRSTALEAEAEAQAAQAQARALEQQIAQTQATLAAALTGLSGLESDEYELALAEAEAVLASAETLRAQARARRDLEARKRALKAAQEAQAEWQAAWERLCASTWIGAPAPDRAGMRAILGVLAELAPLVPQAGVLQRRIRRIEEDVAGFHAELSAMADTLSEPSAPDPMALWPRLRARLREAQTAEAERARLTRELAQARAQMQALEQRRTRLAEATEALRAAFPDQSLSAIDEELRAIAQAAELGAECESLRADLAAHLDTEALEPEIARLDALDHAAAQVEAETLTATLSAQDEALRAAYATLAAAQSARDAAGADGGAARLEAERQTLLLQIAEEARDYMARQAGILALEQALRLYRDTHRSEMMAQASDAFALLTSGRYAGLATQPDGRSEKLIAQVAGGAAKPVDSLSKGTRFQLYLALRAAGYLELARTRPAVPFIADDIMETFDDMRAEAAFRLLAEMARTGQVIYLTHHAHLCEIARRACCEVRVQDLGAL